MRVCSLLSPFSCRCVGRSTARSLDGGFPIWWSSGLSFHSHSLTLSFSPISLYCYLCTPLGRFGCVFVLFSLLFRVDVWSDWLPDPWMRYWPIQELVCLSTLTLFYSPSNHFVYSFVHVLNVLRVHLFCSVPLLTLVVGLCGFDCRMWPDCLFG